MDAASPPNDLRPDEEIVAAALAPSCEEDGERYWSEVRILQNRMSAQLFGKMRDLMTQDEERKRQLAADVVAQGRVAEKELGEHCVRFLLDALEGEKAPRVLKAICNALGHHKSAEAIGPVVRLQGHPNAEVRHAVVFALLCQDDPAAIATLISLSADSDRDVRNWATFGLGSTTEIDTVPLRDALLARLAEADEEIAGEAMVGLALRGDTRVAGPLLEAINAVHRSQNDSEFGTLIFEAAAAIRAAAEKKPNALWQPVLARCDELGFGKRIA